MTAQFKVVAALVLVVGLITAESVDAQDIARLQSGVVKITAKPPSGTANVGTGFIVRLETNAAYIVTAAHVVAGDAQPKVEFFTTRNLPVAAEVLGLEGDDEVRGLALVVVRGPENVPHGLTALSLAATARLSGGEDIIVIGFPRNAGPWALIKGNISSRQGRDIYFSPSVDSGHSGGPVFQNGKVVAVVGAGGQSVGRGITVRSVQDYIEGFGISSQETTSASASAGTEKGEIVRSRTIRLDEKIIGEEGNETPVVHYKAKNINLEQVALDSVKLATFNPQTVLEQSRAGRRALDQLREYVATRQKILKSDEEELRGMEQSQKSGNKSLEQRFREKLQLYEKRVKDFNVDLKSEQQKLVDEFMLKIEKAVRSIAEKEQLDLVVDNFETLTREQKEIMPSELRSLLKEANPNITTAVVQEFDRLYK